MPAVIARTGYTGEDGFELFVDNRRAAQSGTRCSAARRRGTRAVRPGGARRAAARSRHAAVRSRVDRGDHAAASRTGVGVKMANRLSSGKRRSRRRRRRRLPAHCGARARRPSSGARRLSRSGGTAPSSARSAAVRSRRRSGNNNIATALLDPRGRDPGTRLEVEIRGSRHPATSRSAAVLKRNSKLKEK